MSYVDLIIPFMKLAGIIMLLMIGLLITAFIYAINDTDYQTTLKEKYPDAMWIIRNDKSNVPQFYVIVENGQSFRVTIHKRRKQAPTFTEEAINKETADTVKAVHLQETL